MSEVKAMEKADETEKTIAFECDLPQAPEKVWRALTVPELVAAWPMPNDLTPEEGARFTLNGPPEEGGRLYSRQVAEAARLVAEALGEGDYDLVWQSRSGPPQVPWLEPDIVDHIDALHERGVRAVVVVPVGFVSDHLEVVWDLDTEARDRAAELGMGFSRAATAGTDPRFAQLVRELVEEQREGVTARRCGTEPLLGSACNGSLCAVGCCEPPKRPSRPAANG